MTSVRGHLLSIDFVREFRKWHTHSPIRCLDAEIETYCEDDMKNVHDNLQKIARASKVLVLWTDCDREGEHIGWEIQNVCRQVNRNLVVKRAQFSCCTRERCTGPASLREINMGMVNAVIARSELDLRPRCLHAVPDYAHAKQVLRCRRCCELWLVSAAYFGP